MKKNGFTLIELLVTFVILGIVTAIAIPGFARWLPNYRLKSAARELYANMQLARLQAVKENAHVVMLFSPGNNSYEAFVDNGSGGGTADNWTRDGDEYYIVDPNKGGGAMPEGVTMYEASFSGGVPRIRFDGRGFPNGLGGHVYMINSRSKYMGTSLNLVGNPRIIVSEDGTAWD
ncbi:MAG: GspH/FimT family pseudopilin [Deltaproteobacteria bacterium]|nr:GspH/FimT family pseudopilin [Deltaproteobacteria bacterium]